MRWLDPIALPFFTFFLAALARQYGLPVPQLPLRGGSSPWHHQHHAPAQLALPQAPPVPEDVVQEEDFFHLPLQALKVGVADALAHQEAIARGLPFEPAERVPDFLMHTSASFFFGEANGTAFASLRSLWGISNQDFLSSFNSGFTIFTSNSKSRQFFCCTRDNKYMIKTMSREEIRALDDIIGDYWRHMSTNPRSLIVQYCGHYLVRLCRSWEEPPEDVHFLVMRNLLQDPRPGVSVVERYDVKGSTVGRAASEKEKMRPIKEQILKDLDLLRRPVPIDFGLHKSAFLTQVHRDLDFLRAVGVMDYSLLVGIAPLPRHQPPHQFSKRMLSALLGPPHDPLYDAGGSGPLPVHSPGGWLVPSGRGGEAYLCGIIDILQQYNTRKRAETLLKSVVHSRDAISAVDPKAYARRFVEFLDRVIVGGAAPPWGPAAYHHHHQPPPPQRSLPPAPSVQQPPQHSYRFWGHGRAEQPPPPPPPALAPPAA